MAISEILLVTGDSPHGFSRRIASNKQIGLNGAIVLQQVHYWTNKKQERQQDFHDGRYWVYNSFRAWKEQFPFWSERTIKRTFADLEEKGLLLTGNYNQRRGDTTKWYAVNYEKLAEIAGEFDTGK